jgi:hypothetical protein
MSSSSQYYAPRPQAVYAVSVDSRTRRMGEPLNDYTVDLGDVVQRAKSVQVGSIQLPDYGRDALPRASTLPLSEPLDVPVDCRFVINETATTLDRNTHVVLSSSTITAAAYLPPTLNPVITVGVAADGLTITTLYPHGLAEISASYPPQLNAVMVGTAFPWSITSGAHPPSLLDKLLGVTGSQAVSVTPTSFVLPTAELHKCAGAGAAHPLTEYASRIIHSPAYSSYVYVSRPCISEVVDIVNTQLRAAAPALASQPQLAINDSSPDNAVSSGGGGGGSLDLRAVHVPPAESGTKRVHTSAALLDESAGSTGNPWLNLRAASLTPPPPQAQRASASASASAAAAFPLADMWQVRTPPLPPGTYSPGDVETVFSQAASPLRLDDAYAPEDPNTRSFYLYTPSGVATIVTLVAGRYTGPQLALHIQCQIALATGTPPGAVYTVTYLPRTSRALGPSAFYGAGLEAGGKFTFKNTQGLAFGLSFMFVTLTGGGRAPALNRLGKALGFEALAYTGASAYTSPRFVACVPGGGAAGAGDPNLPAGLGITTPVNISGAAERWQREAYGVAVLPPDAGVARKFTVSTAASLAWLSSGVSTLPGSSISNGTQTISGWEMQYTAGQAPALLANPSFAITGATATSLTGVLYPAVTDQRAVLIPIVPQGYHGGEVLHVEAVSGVAGTSAVTAGDVFTAVVAKPWSGLSVTGTLAGTPGVAPYTTMFPTASICGGGGDGATPQAPSALPATGPTVAHPFRVWTNRRAAFQMHMSLPSAPTRVLGFSRQTYPVLAAAGQTPAAGAGFPPSAANRGTGLYGQCPGPLDGAPLNIPSSYTAPYSMDLLPQRYILMLLRAASPPSKRQTHVWRDSAFPILAKFIMHDGQNFVRVTEDMTNYVFTDFARLTQMRVSFVYGDGSPVDFNGHEHTFTLLFTTAQGDTEALCT